MICRVFQKSFAGAVGPSGGKKGKVTVAYPQVDVDSPSSSSLPPLLDSSIYGLAVAGTGGGGGVIGDRESCCSYDSETVREHVPCFSNMAGYVPPPAVVGVGHPGARFGLSLGFPSMGSLQDSLQVPFCFPAAEVGGRGWPGEEEKVDRARMALGPTELDCMWTF